MYLEVMCGHFCILCLFPHGSSNPDLGHHHLRERKGCIYSMPEKTHRINIEQSKFSKEAQLLNAGDPELCSPTCRGEGSQGNCLMSCLRAAPVLTISLRCERKGIFWAKGKAGLTPSLLFVLDWRRSHRKGLTCIRPCFLTEQ